MDSMPGQQTARTGRLHELFGQRGQVHRLMAVAVQTGMFCQAKPVFELTEYASWCSETAVRPARPPGQCRHMRTDACATVGPKYRESEFTRR
jgi:hypothetical protein